MKKPELKAVLLISDFHDGVDSITQMLGVQPTFVVRKGEVGRHGHIGKTNCWSFKTKRTSDRPLDDLLRDLFSEFSGSWQELVALCQRCNVEVLCEVWTGPECDTNPELSIEPKTVATLAELNCSVGFDIYS